MNGDMSQRGLSGTRNRREFPAVRVLGIFIAAIQIPELVVLVEQWIKERTKTRYVAFCGMHGLMEARKDQHVFDAIDEADVVAPDGMPLVWLARLHGERHMHRRVYGPEFMNTFCQKTGKKYKHFLYGGSETVVQALAVSLSAKFGIEIVGIVSPPFRPLEKSEFVNYANLINDSGADIVWVGISTPKQDLFMHRIKPLLKSKILFGVGAAFDFNAGVKMGAPAWMQENGLEWLFRLLTEPRRLWYRYIVLGPQFVVLALIDFLKSKMFKDGIDS